MKEDWKEYVTFSKKERNGVVVLLLLVVLLSVMPWFIPAPDVKLDERITKEWQSKLAAWKRPKNPLKFAEPSVGGNGAAAIAADENTFGPPENSDIAKPLPIGLFPFDPNRISQNEWIQLGVSGKVARTISNYLNKGGQFRKPEDLARIYGMKPGDAQRLAPWVRIAVKPRPSTLKEFVAERPQTTGLTYPYTRKKRYFSVDINTADTSDWAGFPGIGAKLALRIVQYREKLGGFHAADQVGETWALPDSTFQQIRPWLQCNGGKVRKILINSATVDELQKHPYLRWQLANAIVQYRQQHGDFRSAADLQKIILVTPLLITKIAPYIEY